MGTLLSVIPGVQPTQPPSAPSTPVDYPALLRANTYFPIPSSPYPYHLIQLSDTDELPYNDQLVSDALVHHIRTQSRPYTHLILHTHGWNTSPQKAIEEAFAQFLGGMQNDAAMPRDPLTFRPLFLAVIWPGLPTSFAVPADALTRLQLIEQSERDSNLPNSDISLAASACRSALHQNDPEEENMLNNLRTLALHAHQPDVTKPDIRKSDTEPDANLDADPDPELRRLRDNAQSLPWAAPVAGAASAVASRILAPFEYLVFHRIATRAERVGHVLARIVAKLMRAQKDVGRLRVCASGNSIAAHVLAAMVTGEGVRELEEKLHAVFLAQGAIEQRLFASGGRFEGCVNGVAGPVLGSYSRRDRILGWMFEVFYDDAVGYVGFEDGERFVMKRVEETVKEPYRFANGWWNSVDGTEFIDEGPLWEGGHGDYKEDETTSMYWAAITADVDDEAYKL